MSRQIRRRTVVRGIGAAATAGVLAGCSTETQGDGTDTEGGDGDGTGTDGGAGTDGGDSGSVPSEVSDYLSDANNYDGNVADETGTDNPTVDVGAGNGLAFGPAAVRISTGTTITWEWTGAGSPHNVIHDGGNFESELMSDEGATFEHTFEDSGNYLYYCRPHQGQGMKGTVVVE